MMLLKSIDYIQPKPHEPVRDCGITSGTGQARTKEVGKVPGWLWFRGVFRRERLAGLLAGTGRTS